MSANDSLELNILFSHEGYILQTAASFVQALDGIV